MDLERLNCCFDGKVGVVVFLRARTEMDIDGGIKESDESSLKAKQNISDFDQ